MLFRPSNFTKENSRAGGTKPPTRDTPEYGLAGLWRADLKAAKQLGLTIPPNVLARADRVIKWIEENKAACYDRIEFSIEQIHGA